MGFQRERVSSGRASHCQISLHQLHSFKAWMIFSIQELQSLQRGKESPSFETKNLLWEASRGGQTKLSRKGPLAFQIAFHPRSDTVADLHVLFYNNLSHKVNHYLFVAQNGNGHLLIAEGLRHQQGQLSKYARHQMSISCYTSGNHIYSIRSLPKVSCITHLYELFPHSAVQSFIVGFQLNPLYLLLLNMS